MTFLELAQKIASESGTVPGSGKPATVTEQAGRLAKVVRWTNDAWVEIQNLRRDWRWMQGEFEGNTINLTARYDAAAMGITERFAEWKYGGTTGENDFLVYETALGPIDEGNMIYLDWDDFYTRYERGVRQTGKPTVFTIAPDNKLAFYPVPDDDYTIRGRYQKSAQNLVADADIPEMPVRFHDIIKWRALMLLGVHDEAPEQYPAWSGSAGVGLGQLERDQLPRIRMAGSLA